VPNGGSLEIVSFDSVLAGNTATQEWQFDAGTVTLVEQASPVAIPGTTL
jgi:hypothetical protein